jgi:hypothetical protein
MRAKLIAEIFRYVSGEAGINDLHGWLVAHLQAIQGSGDDVAMKIADQLDVDLIHLSDGVVSEQTVWEHLVKVIQERDPFRLAVHPIESGHTTGWGAKSYNAPLATDIRLTVTPR